MSATSADVVRFVAPDVKTARGRQNVFYRQIALQTLMPYRDELEWLIPSEADINAGKPLRFGILAELGRCTDVGTMLQFARAACTLKLPAKAMQAAIRRSRLGRKPEPNMPALMNQVIAAISDYIVLHPEWTPELVMEALTGAWGWTLAADEARKAKRDGGA